MVVGAGFIHTISTKGINEIKKDNCKKKVKFHAYKKILYIFLKTGAISFGCNFTYTEEPQILDKFKKEKNESLYQVKS